MRKNTKSKATKKEVVKINEPSKPYLTLSEETDVASFLHMAASGMWKCDIPESWRKFALKITPKLRRVLKMQRQMCEGFEKFQELNATVVE